MTSRSEVRCSRCGLVLHDEEGTNRQPCDLCGSLSRTYSEHLEATIQLRSQLKWRHRRAGLRRPLAEGVSGSERSVRSGRWVVKKRVIDREKNWYEEVIVDEETGEVVRDSHEPLSDHAGHGSAKRESTRPEDLVSPDRYVDRHDQEGEPHG